MLQVEEGEKKWQEEKDSLLQALITITERFHMQKGCSHLYKKKHRGTLSSSNHKGNQTDNKLQRFWRFYYDSVKDRKQSGGSGLHTITELKLKQYSLSEQD